MNELSHSLEKFLNVDSLKDGWFINGGSRPMCGMKSESARIYSASCSIEATNTMTDGVDTFNFVLEQYNENEKDCSVLYPLISHIHDHIKIS